ncbi:MAG: hypothetical protein LCH32_11685 [Bacteroidetes bacterium]|nr:hypothetical protein [Bacteroidota bacterium]
MLKGIQNIALKNLIKNYSNNAATNFVNWDKITSILLLIDSNEINKNELDKYLKSSQKHIEIIYFELKAKDPKFKDFKTITNKDVNLLKLPKNKLNGNYDLIINCCSNTNNCAIAFSIQTKAKLKCAFFDFEKVYNLVLQPKNNLIENLKEAEHYLNMIKN